MATNSVSDIESSAIDGEYPVAGVDNDTQGFRDNFSIIKSNFETSKQEITDLYQRTPKLDEENNFNGSAITQAVLKASTSSYYKPGTFNQNSAVIDFTNGHYQQIVLSDQISNIDFNITGWPDTEKFAHFTMEFTSIADHACTVDFSNPGIVYDPFWPDDLTINSETNPVVVEAWTFNSGSKVYLKYIGQFEEVDFTTGGRTNEIYIKNLKVDQLDYGNINNLINEDFAINIASPSDKDFLIYNSSSGVWENSKDYSINGISIDNSVIGAISPEAITGTQITASTGFTGNLTGDVTGDVTGNVLGNLNGDVTGDVTGNLTGNVTGNVSGNVTGNVTGDLNGDVAYTPAEPLDWSGSLPTTESEAIDRLATLLRTLNGGTGA